MNREGGRDRREHPTEVLGVGGVLGGQARTNRDAESEIPPLTHPKISFLPSVHTLPPPQYTHPQHPGENPSGLFQYGHMRGSLIARCRTSSSMELRMYTYTL